MNKRILNNKIGIQIMLIIMGAVLLILGLLCSTIPGGYFDGSGRTSSHFSGYFYSDFYIYVGVAIFFIGIALIIIASIKIANYALLKKSSKPVAAPSETATPRVNMHNDNVDYIRNRIASLQQMRTEGLINDTEYEEMKSSIIKNSGELLK